MATATLLHRGAISAFDYRCDAGPADRPYAELHGDYSVSYVRRGSFGCRCRGRTYDLVAGSVLVGRPGDEYICLHDHVAGGDECLSFHFPSSIVETIGNHDEIWRHVGVPPLPELMMVGELAQEAAEGRGDMSLDELGVARAYFLGRQTGLGRPEHFGIAEAPRQGEPDALVFLHKAFVPIDQPVIGVE